MHLEQIEKSKRLLGYLFLCLAIIFTASLLTWTTVRIVKAVQFQNNCAAYESRAIGAPNIEIAKTELSYVINYAEKNNLTEGIVSIFFKNPKNDVGYWYGTLKATYKALEDFPTDAGQLSETNFLMRMHESLEEVGVPSGITIYPHNAFYFWWSLLSLVGAVVFWHLFVKEKFWW